MATQDHLTVDHPVVSHDEWLEARRTLLEGEGHSIFYKDSSGTVFHTYSCYARGNDKLNLHDHYLDLVAKGRDEGGRGPYWVRRRDEYDR